MNTSSFMSYSTPAGFLIHPLQPVLVLLMTALSIYSNYSAMTHDNGLLMLKLNT